MCEGRNARERPPEQSAYASNPTHVTGHNSACTRWPSLAARCLRLPQRAALKPPGGAAQRPGPGAGRSCFKLRRPAGWRLSPRARAQRRLLAPGLQCQPGPGLGPGPGPRASPAAVQGAGLPVITYSARLCYAWEPRVSLCKLRLLHLPPQSQLGRPSEPWLTRGCNSWASSWPSWAGSEPSPAQRCPSGRLTPMRATTS